MLPEDVDTRVACLRVSDDTYDRLCVCRDGRLFLYCNFSSRDAAEDVLDLLLHLVYVNVTYYDDSLIVREIPLLVEVSEALVLECLELLLASDEGSS